MFLGGNFIWFTPPHHNYELSEAVCVLKVHIDAGSKDQRGKGLCTPGAVGSQVRTCLMSLLGCPSCRVVAGAWGKLGWNVGLDGWECTCMEKAKGRAPLPRGGEPIDSRIH